MCPCVSHPLSMGITPRGARPTSKQTLYSGATTTVSSPATEKPRRRNPPNCLSISLDIRFCHKEPQGLACAASPRGLKPRLDGVNYFASIMSLRDLTPHIQCRYPNER